MARSLKKRTFVHYKLDKKVQENIAGGNKGYGSRAMITQTLLGKLSLFITVVNLYPVYVTENMVGHKLEFFTN
jgi:small subunit ribosomal protein S19